MHIATYGSLTFPEVMTALLGRDFASEKIVLNGYARFTLIGKPYPGIITTNGSKVEGRIYFDLDPVSIKILDRFEDEIYEHIVTTINTPSRGPVQAKVYVIPVSSINLLSRSPWIVEDFAKVHLTEFVEGCRRFRAKILDDVAG